MRAVILAGGRGRRLQPFTSIIPKPLVPVGEHPILEIVLRQLVAAEFSRVTLTLGHLGELIQAFVAGRPALVEGIDIDYVTEPEPTGTAGSLALVPGLDDTFLVMNGDILTDLDYGALVRHHREQGNALTIAGCTKAVRLDLGVLALDGEMRVIDYIEKPEFTRTVSMGVYVYEPEVLEHIPCGAYLDFPDLVLRLIEAERRVGCFQSEGIWLDIGTPEDHEHAQRLFDGHRERFLPHLDT